MNDERTYRVVRFIDQWPLGRQQKVLASGLSIDDARDLAETQEDGLETEEIIIQEEDTGDEVEIH